MMVLVLVAIDLTVVMIAAIWLAQLYERKSAAREKLFMASIADVTDSFNNLSTSVQNLANAYQAKAAGIDPAALDPLKVAMDQLKSAVDGVIAPPAPVPGS